MKAALDFKFQKEHIMDKSENLAIPYIMSNQAQKHVTHNEAIRYLDALVQISIVSRELNSPPSQVDAGMRYIVASSANGEWANKENQIAAFQDGAWAFYAPKSGWLAWSVEESLILVFKDGNWEQLQPVASSIQQVELLGVNTSANTDARFGVSSNNSFFTHQGDSHQLSVNKFQASDTGSLVFKTDWTGHAEVGLAGDNNFSIKVSDDGINWNESLVLSSDNGKVSFPSGMKNTQLSGVPEKLNAVDIFYIDQNLGDDDNDGSSPSQSIKTLQRFEQLFSIGRRVKLRLLSDLVWDYAIRINYPVAMLEILGRKADNSGYEIKTITVKDSVNASNMPGCLQMNCISSVYLRSINVNLDTGKGQAFLNYATTLGYLRTYTVTLNRTGTGSCCLFADGSSFVASRHQAMTIDPSAKGYVAQGVGAGKNPNNDWRYTSNLNAF